MVGRSWIDGGQEFDGGQELDRWRELDGGQELDGGREIEVARQSLARPTYERYRVDPYLRNFQQHSNLTKPQHDV